MLSKSFFGRWLKNAFHVSGQTIWGETTNWTKNLFRSNFGTWTWKCGPFRETFQFAGQNGILHRQRIILKSAYRFKVWLSLFFADFEQKEVSPSAKSFGSCVKTAFYVLRESVWRNMFFLEKEVCFNVLGPWAEKLGPPGEHPSTTLRKLYITNPEKQAKQFLLCNLCFFNHSRRLSQRFLAVQQVVSDTFNKTAFYLFGETFWWIAKIWKKIRFNFQRLVLNLKEVKKRYFGKYLKPLIAGPDDLFQIF